MNGVSISFIVQQMTPKTGALKPHLLFFTNLWFFWTALAAAEWPRMASLTHQELYLELEAWLGRLSACFLNLR